MQAETVVAAVHQLKTREQRVTLRAVAEITGGSHRDLTRLLREILATEEMDTLEAEIAEPVGQLEHARLSLEKAEAGLTESQLAFQRQDEHVRHLQTQRPQWTTDLARVAEVELAKIAYELELATAQRELKAFEHIRSLRRAERDALRADLDKVRTRVHDLRQQFPRYVRELQDAEQEAARRRVEAATLIRVGEAELQAKAQVLAWAEAQLKALLGELHD